MPLLTLTVSLISLIRNATSWAAFERSSPKVWGRLQRGVEAVLQNAWRQGAFVGETASEALRVEFGVAPTVPGEFIRMRMEQPSGAWTIYLD